MIWGKHANPLDKNLKPVNKAGWLVDSDGNIIDVNGQIKFVQE